MAEAETKEVHVFISHKHEDQGIAELLNQRLELYGDGRVSCFISERIAPSADWFEKIRENLANSDVLILLFTATHASWDWPLYEVGLATNLDDETPCKIVCFHPPDASPPDPIKFAQSVRADRDGIDDFLYKFFCTPEITGCDPPINQKLADDRPILADLAKQVAKGFKSVQPWENYFTNFLWIVVSEGQMEGEQVPDSAWIDPKSEGLSAFGLAPKPPGKDHWVWSDLLEKANRPEDAVWIRELGERFFWASKGENLKSMTERFVSPANGQVFRPLVHRVDLRSDSSMLFEVILVEEDGA